MKHLPTIRWIVYNNYTIELRRRIMGIFDNTNLETEYLRTLSVKKRKEYKEKSVSVKKKLLNQFKYETETFNNKASHDIIKRYLESQGIYEPTETMISAIEHRKFNKSTNSDAEKSHPENLDSPLDTQTDKLIKQNEEIIHQNKKIIKLLTKLNDKK